MRFSFTDGTILHIVEICDCHHDTATHHGYAEREGQIIYWVGLNKNE